MRSGSRVKSGCALAGEAFILPTLPRRNGALKAVRSSALRAERRSILTGEPCGALTVEAFGALAGTPCGDPTVELRHVLAGVLRSALNVLRSGALSLEWCTALSVEQSSAFSATRSIVRRGARLFDRRLGLGSQPRPRHLSTRGERALGRRIRAGIHVLHRLMRMPSFLALRYPSGKGAVFNTHVPSGTPRPPERIHLNNHVHVG